MSGNPRNKFSGFKDGKHGTEIFGPHPELPKQIVAWYADTLVKSPADPGVAVKAKNTPMREFWQKVSSPDSVPAAVQLFDDTRRESPRTVLFPEEALNQLGYQYLQGGRVGEAIQLFRMNTIAYPWSANTFDSLGDGYLANGQDELALRVSEKALQLLEKDKADDARKKAIRDSAEQKIAKLKGSVKK
jgi:tetratricopeptide (TPR) repeat protein